VLFGLAKSGGPTDHATLAAAHPHRLRTLIESAVKDNLVPAETLTTLDRSAPALARLQANDTPIRMLASAGHRPVPDSLLRRLGSKGIKTLADVRSIGGLARLRGVNQTTDSRAIRVLDAHARLLTLSSDVALNKRLIAKGYDSIGAVARATPEDIAKAIGDKQGSTRAMALHANARVQGAYIQNVVMGLVANAASGLVHVAPDSHTETVTHEALQATCACNDCDAAVSPRAYLADLMQYAIDHLRNSGNKVSLSFFEENFHQPFSDLPATCTSEEEAVHQVRICTEVLRSYLGQRPLSPIARETMLKEAERHYLLQTYQLLLTKFGTSFTEIRLAHGAPLADQDTLADRIGVSVDALPELFLDPTATPPQLTEARLEYLFGLADSTQPPIRQMAEPAMKTWRRSHLRELWKAEDWPADDYSAKTRSIIDPDLIGPDDFRYPDRHSSVNDPDKAFDLWVARRTWADGFLESLKGVPARQAAAISGPDFQGVVAAMGAHAYNGGALQWPATALGTLRTMLAGMTAQNAEATTKALYADYGLSLDAARRVIDLWEKDNQFWKTPARAAKLTDDEWSEIHSILLRAEKTSLQALWMREEVEAVIKRASGPGAELRKVWTQDEDAGQVLLGQRELWTPLRRPVEGNWPPIRVAGIPLIDPETTKRGELPDSTAGGKALTLWDDRAAALASKGHDLQAALDSAGFEAMLALAFAPDAVPVLATWVDYFRATAADLTGTDPAKSATATIHIEQVLRLSLDGFQRIATVMESDAAAGSKPLPSKADWADVFALLTAAWKRKTLYAGWYAEEVNAVGGVEPWRCAKHALTKWRATLDERQQWDRALAFRSRAPLIDPDLLASTGYLKNPGGGDASALWEARRKAIGEHFLGLQQQGIGASRTAASLGLMTNAVLGSSVLQELANATVAGIALSARLLQVNLTFAELGELLRVNRLLTGIPPEQVLDSEWDSICSILTQVWKQRQVADWQLEERTKGISLNPDLFQLLPIDVTQFPPGPPPVLDPWRGPQDTLLDWQDKLQSRIDQEQTVNDAIAAALSDVEEQTLPALRDALVMAADPSALSTTPAGRRLGNRLAIATDYSGCSKTTRISLAIESFQIVMWAVRTGILDDVYPNLTLAAPYFDEEWKWIGSYANWRAAMFVFLYPENLMLPSLRRHQTPAFRALVDGLRNVNKLTPAQARQVAAQHASYIRDICSLKIIASCRVPGPLSAAGVQSPLFFMFAYGPVSHTSYWSVHDEADSSGMGQTFWQRVPGLAGSSMIGAVPYKVYSADTYDATRYIFLFAVKGQKLVFVRFNLDFADQQVDTDATELDVKLPDASTEFSAVVKQRSTDDQPPCVVVRSGGGAIYLRYLNHEGNTWETADWRVLVDQDDATSLSLTALEAVIGYDDYWFYIVVAGRDGSLKFKLLHDYCTPIYHAFQSGTNDDFVTSSKGEYDSSAATLGYDKLGILGYMSTAPLAGTVPLYRLFGTNSGLHYYTSSADERYGLIHGNPSIRDEGIEGYLFQSQVADTVQFHRITSPGFAQPREWQSIPQSSWIGGLRVGIQDFVYLFWKVGATAKYKPLARGVEYTEFGQYPELELDRLAIHSSAGVSIETPRLAYQRGGASSGLFRSTIAQVNVIQLTNPNQSEVSIAPKFAGPFDIPESVLSTPQLAATTRDKITGAWVTNRQGPSSDLEYLKELFYFVPVHIALQWQKSGNFIAALDWLRLVYDYTAPIAQRALLGLPPELPATATTYQRKIQTWLLDPLNPHAIGQTRANAYSRYTQLSIIKCVLGYAETEFTQDTSESVPRSRELYEVVLSLLESDELKQSMNGCDQLIGDLEINVDDTAWQWMKAHVQTVLKTVRDPRELGATVKQIFEIMSTGIPTPEQYHTLEPILLELVHRSEAAVPFSTRIEYFPEKGSQLESVILSDRELEEALRTQSATREQRVPVPTTVPFGFCVPPNPVLRSLRMAANLNLYKIRNCRNIAGMRRELEAFASPPDSTSGMPAIGGGGQLVIPGSGGFQPTLYRYATLVDRAKQLVQQAVQVEAAFFSALEKSDKEAFDLFNARANVRLTQAGVRLQDLHVAEALDSVKAAQLQRDRATIQSKTYDNWITAGLSADELALMGWYDWLAGYQIFSANLAAAIQGFTAGVAIGPAFWIQAAYQAANAAKTIADSLAINAQREISRLNVLISHESKVQEWSLQKTLADQDIQIGDQQIQLANDNVQIAGQERAIEKLKADNAQDVVNFLTNKFTNKELYDWMSGILQGVYSFFLQQATSIAQLAEKQLAFERQETPPRYIQDDYWEAPDDNTGVSASNGKVPDRRGLTGSARLLQDIYQLDQYAFEKNRRKQQVTKIISLAQFNPLAFQRFQETGILPFTMPMELFDRDFPGHYLRLIKRLRTSVVALIPPTEGIKATLTCSGLSRVVIGGDIFQTTLIRRPPEIVALSSAINATGLFELQEQPEMLVPLEGHGVAMSLEFALPRPSNPFDFSTIADVLITLDYTALNSFDYAQEMVQLLNSKRTMSGDRAFSFRNQFADAWYDLNNPDQSATPMSVELATVFEDFPPNVDNLRVQHVTLYFGRSAGAKIEFESVDLRFEQPGGGSLGGACNTNGGLISTRSGNGGGWLSLIDVTPIGTWRLSLPDSEQTRLWFKREDISDILFVITYGGRLPEWPT